MAAFTQADLDAVNAAIIELGVSGVASCTVGGHTVQATDIEKLLKLRSTITQDLASALGSGGMRFRQLVPGGTG